MDATNEFPETNSKRQTPDETKILWLTKTKNIHSPSPDSTSPTTPAPTATSAAKSPQASSNATTKPAAPTSGNNPRPKPNKPSHKKPYNHAQPKPSALILPCNSRLGTPENCERYERRCHRPTIHPNCLMRLIAQGRMSFHPASSSQMREIMESAHTRRQVPCTSLSSRPRETGTP